MAMMTPIPPTLLGLMTDFQVAGSESGTRSAIERLFDQLHAHEREESETLAEYEHAATTTTDAGVQFLMNLVLEDERRHHQLIQSMADDVNQSLQWIANGSALPTISARGTAGDRLLEQTRHFLEVERAGVRQLEDLRAEVKELRSGLLALLVELMELDTRKHVEILRYIERQLEQRRS